MTQGQQDQPQRKRRKRVPGSLVAHRAFAPVLGLWGVALAAAPVMVVPPALIETATAGTHIASFGELAQPALAGFAGVLLGGLIFAVAAFMTARARSSADAPSVAQRAVRNIRPIDPTRDLGSRSLDDPLDAMPFAKPAWQDEPAGETEPQEPAASEPEAQPAPVAMDLAAFAQMPGRNAVWVDEQVAAEPAPVDEPVAETAPPVVSAAVASLPLPEPGTAALARLRALPTSELSMAEMVERFAGALHEHRASPPNRSLSAADLAAREAALAEALKALATLSGEDGSNSVREPLRAALAQLQTPRRAGSGAA